MQESSRHVTEWDAKVRRAYSPVYSLLGHRYDPEPSPPVRVEVSATFDDNESALAFERAVQELLEKS